MNPIRKILIVEDEFLFAFDLKMQLAKMGYQVCELAATGEKALQIMNREHPELVLLDLNLAGAMSGLSASQAIAAQGVPIIFMTGLLDEDSLEQARQVSPLACLLKPIHPKEIQLVISAYEQSQGQNNTRG